MKHRNLEISKRRPIRCLLAFLLTAASLWALWEAARWPLMPTHDAAMMFPDEFYQALCCRNYTQAPLGMLTFWMGHVWTALWGESLLNLRRLAWLLVALSNAMGCWWLWRRTANPLLTAVTFFIATLASLVYCCDNYDWNVGCYPFVVALALLTLRFVNRPSLWVSTAIGAVSAAMVMAKVTTAPAVAISVAIIWYSLRHEVPTLAKSLATALAGIVVAALVLATAMCGSPQGYLAAFTPENIITGHTDLLNIFDTVKRTFFPVLSTGAVIAVMMFATPLIASLSPGRKAAAFWLCAGAIIVGFLTIKEIVLTQYVFGEFYYSPGLMLLPFAGFCLLPLVAHRLRGFEYTHHIKMTLAIAVLYPCVLAVGSDTPLIRLFVMPMLPLAVWAALQSAPLLARRWLAILALSLVIVTGYFRFWQQRDILTSPYDYSHIARIGAIHCSPTDPLPQYFEMLGKDYLTLTGNFGAENVVVTGPCKYIVDYLFTNGAGYSLNHFHYPENPAQAITEAIAGAEGMSPMPVESASQQGESDRAATPLSAEPYRSASAIMVINELGATPQPISSPALIATPTPYGTILLNL